MRLRLDSMAMRGPKLFAVGVLPEFMKSTLFSFAFGIKFFVVFLLAVSQTGVPQTQDRFPDSSFAGVVLNSANSQPLGHVVVVATPEKGGQADMRAVETSADGRFQFANLPAGRYQIAAQRSGFGWPVNVPKMFADAGKDAKTAEIVIQLVPNAAASGRVTGPDGEPLLGAIVQLSRLQFVNGHFVNAPVSRVATNDLGEYRIFAVPPGHYRVSAFYRDSASMFGLRLRPAPQDAPSDGHQTQDYTVTYFPGTNDADSATTVRLRPGETQGGIDIHLLTAPSASISGSVSNLPPGADGIQVILQPVGFAELGARQSFAVHTGNNRFEFKSLPQGTYVLRVDFGGPEHQLSAREVITVRETPVNNVNLNLRPHFTVGGTVATTEKKVPGGLVLALVGTDLPNRAVFKINTDGTFQAPWPLPPDDYGVELQNNQGSVYLKTIIMRGQKINSPTVRIEESTNLELTVSDTGSKVEGMVKNADEQPVNNCVVILADAEAAANRVYFSRPDNGGRFALTAVPPGKYSIGCLSGLASEQDVSPEILGKVRLSGRGITVDEKQSVSVSLSPSTEDSN
jgi:hypothetical protein